MNDQYDDVGNDICLHFVDDADERFDGALAPSVVARGLQHGQHLRDEVVHDDSRGQRGHGREAPGRQVTDSHERVLQKHA